MHKLLLLIAIFICAASSQEDPPVPPPPVPIAAQIRLANGFDQTANLSLTIFDGEVPRISRSLSTGVHQIIHLPNGAATFYVQVAHEGLRSILFTDYVTLEVGKSYSYVVTSSSHGVLLEDTPEVFTLAASYVRLMSCLQGNDSIIVELNALSVSETAELRNGEYTDFFQIQPGEYSIFVNGINATQFISNTSATTICLLGNGTTSTSIYEFGQQLRYQIPDRPLCYAGYTESNGFCNCYSGAYSDSYIMRCFNVAPNECFNRTVSRLDNDVVPFVNWQETQVYGDRLNMTIYSEVVSSPRRTLIEMPNALCNYIYSPQYYQKTVSDCKDIYRLAIPFEECGFVKTSTPNDDFYKGTIIVKQIDHLVIGEWYQPRVIETSFPVSIRIPKTLAIYSYVQVYGPPNLELDSIFVGQSVNTQEKSAYLAYMSVVPYPLKVDSAEAVDMPFGVSATIDIVDVNCTSAAPCLQRFDVQLSSSGCSISGVYRLAVTLSCRTQTGCPEEVFINGTDVYLESRIVAQSLCSEVSVDIDLIGTIQAFTNNDLSTEVYALYPGQSAYFRISAYSPRVSLSSITLNSVYYSGPNGYQFLLAEGNLSSVAEANDFAWGSLDATRAWFSVDVTVSPPSSVEETLFKLNQGETAWHYFVAIVDVEWGDFSPYSAPVYQPAAAVKKRLVLQGPVSNQGSQFNSRVQVTGPTLQPSDNVSDAVSTVSTTCLALVILAVALVL